MLTMNNLFSLKSPKMTTYRARERRGPERPMTRAGSRDPAITSFARVFARVIRLAARPTSGASSGAQDPAIPRSRLSRAKTRVMGKSDRPRVSRLTLGENGA